MRQDHGLSGGALAVAPATPAVHTCSMPVDREKLRAKLEALKAGLETPVDSSAADRAPVELDQTSVGRLSRIDAMQVQERHARLSGGQACA